MSWQKITMEANVLPYNSVKMWKFKLILYIHRDSMLNYSIQYQIVRNDFDITFKYTKFQPYCKMLKVSEAVKSFLNVVQKLELYVNMQCVMHCKTNTHIHIFLFYKWFTRLSWKEYSDDSFTLVSERQLKGISEQFVKNGKFFEKREEKEFTGVLNQT